MLGTHRTNSPLLACHGMANRRSVHHRTRRGWRVEQLEGRTLLSILPVTSTYDSGDNAHPGDNTLRWAIEKANDNNGDDTIDIQVTGTITLKSALPDLNDTTPGVTAIKGPGAASLTVARSSDPGLRSSASSRLTLVPKPRSTALRSRGAWPIRAVESGIRGT